MPQLDLLTYPSQLFWLGLSFGILYWMMAKKIVPAIEAVMARRDDHIDTHLRKAEKLQKQAETLQQKHHDILAKANEEARLILDKQNNDLNNQYETQKKQLEQQLKKQLEQAQTSIQTAQKDALAQLEQASHPLLKTMISKSANINLSDDELSEILKKNEI